MEAMGAKEENTVQIYLVVARLQTAEEEEEAAAAMAAAAAAGLALNIIQRIAAAAAAVPVTLNMQRLLLPLKMLTAVYL